MREDLGKFERIARYYSAAFAIDPCSVSITECLLLQCDGIMHKELFSDAQGSLEQLAVELEAAKQEVRS